jgi:hypothetical protein
MFSFSWDVKAYKVNKVYDYVYTIYKQTREVVCAEMMS